MSAPGSPGSFPGEVPPGPAPEAPGGRRRWWGSLVASVLLHGAALGALVWAAVPWVRVAPPDDAVLVTLLAGGQEATAGTSAPGPSEPVAEAAPAPAPPPPAPAAPRIVEAPRRAKAPARPPAPARPAPPDAPAPERAAPADPAGAADPGSPAGDGGSSSGAAVAAIPPGAAGAGPSDASRVYGEGEVDRAAAPVGGIRRPEYPARERMLGREGRVSLRVTVDAAGAVRAVAVTRSGGDAFDRSARRAVEATPFRAARLADRPVASTVTVDVRFELD